MKQVGIIMKKYFTILLSAVLLLMIAQTVTAEENKVPAFPGADGFGKYTTGGRGGKVIIVENLNDSGPGSLREAVETKGPRIVVFNVSGTIHLESPLTISKPDITIAGQSAPGDGICIADNYVKIKADNVIIRFIRSRLGDVHGINDDAMNCIRNKDIIIDHCSLSWSIDETGSFYDNENFTLQWCILSESLYKSAHAKGQHGYGGIWGGMKASFHHNLLAHHTSRNPRFCGARYHQSTADKELVDFRNNVIYNWGFNSSYAGESGKTNMVANYYKPGPATKKNVQKRILEAWKSTDRRGTHDYGKFYIADNIMSGNDEVSSDNWKGVDIKNYNEQEKINEHLKGNAYDSIFPLIKVDSPFLHEISYTQPAEDAYISVLAHAGVSLKRDEVDKRIIREVETGTATFGDSYGEKLGIIDSQNSVGGWPILNSSVPPKDSDNDGIPDEWEIKNGLDPQNTNDATQYSLSDKYSNIEVYLNQLVEHIIK